MPGLKELGLQPHAPVLETFLARANVTDTGDADLESTLFTLFDVPAEQGMDLPSASICRLADGGEMDDAFWLHADPVYLKPAGDKVLLFDAGMLDIRQSDAAELALIFNRHFAQDGWLLEALSHNRWYLRLPAAPAITTRSLIDAIGRNIEQFMPAGAEASKWRSALNEVQMLFHSADVNRQRELEHLLPVNSVWFSGGGRLPEVPGNTFDRVLSDTPLALGLARLAEITSAPLSLDTLLEVRSGEQVVVYHQILRSVLDADPQGWVDAVERFAAWGETMQKMLQKKQIDVLRLYPCDGRVYQVDRNRLRRFWVSRRPISQ
ncbi:hypothetical protein MNBD_GAMMA26-1291 [hydrothermal vent metagenome]|uniref:Regulatory protein, RpfE type n=1 Tax=hydrothermal vent metagenome TaxID=652676 RepID=A0A3B1BHU9_9ZZZZ